MINVDAHSCTGCRVCEALCPAHCIRMVADDEGFLVARADASACLECGLCESRCPEHVDLFHETGVQRSYALRWADDPATVAKSASGGAFAALALTVLERGGVVYGAAFDKDLVVRHASITHPSELWRLQGSKYVQSDTGDSFFRARDDLEQGSEVLYSGTPCQIAGLRSFLGKDYEKLCTVDVVCHGVPSPLLFVKYLEWARTRYGRILEYGFRSKRFGWGLVMRIRGSKRTAYVSSNDPFNHAYMWAMSFREKCYGCRYARMERVSDVSLFDCWGIQRTYPKFYDKCGVSGVLTNTERGRHLLEDAGPYVTLLVPAADEIVAHVGNLHAPSRRPSDRDTLYQGIRELDGNSFTRARLLPKVSMSDRIKALVPYAIKYPIRRALRKF